MEKMEGATTADLSRRHWNTLGIDGRGSDGRGWGEVRRGERSSRHTLDSRDGVDFEDVLHGDSGE
jgi:hypothetical protein